MSTLCTIPTIEVHILKRLGSYCAVELEAPHSRTGGVSGYPQTWNIRQFGEFDTPRVHSRMNSWGLFLAHRLTRGKRERVS